MVWFITLAGVNITQKHNLFSETISNIFLVLWSDVPKCRMCTSDPSEHRFGNMGRICREFSCTDFVSLVEKLQRQISMIFCSDLNASSSIYGYQSTFESWGLFIRQDRRRSLFIQNIGDVI